MNQNKKVEIEVRGSSEKIFKENIRRVEMSQITWPDNWQWCVDLFREREKVILEYKKIKKQEKGSGEYHDERTLLPFPETCAREIGWLASKKEFQLEIFGGYYNSSKFTPSPADVSSSEEYTSSSKSDGK
ncbi:UNVERIFIED_CONTAM: hypothetical protein PYX00_001919 [Menopon gallinae]|uniref:Uncharacterized protein n=1 Tax=Menopon gallinae TaxID=328185 RepID=A0AAW2IEQ4_9NEOP